VPLLLHARVGVVVETVLPPVGVLRVTVRAADWTQPESASVPIRAKIASILIGVYISPF